MNWAAILSDVLSIEWGLRKLLFKEYDLDELVSDSVLLFSSGFRVRFSGARGFGFLGLSCLGDAEPWSSFHDLARLHDQRNKHHERNERIDRMTRVRNVEFELPNSRMLQSYSKGDTDMMLICIAGPQTHPALAPHHRVA
jgi:hypothetical protein